MGVYDWQNSTTVHRRYFGFLNNHQIDRIKKSGYRFEVIQLFDEQQEVRLASELVQFNLISHVFKHEDIARKFAEENGFCSPVKLNYNVKSRKNRTGEIKSTAKKLEVSSEELQQRKKDLSRAAKLEETARKASREAARLRKKWES